MANKDHLMHNCAKRWSDNQPSEDRFGRRMIFGKLV